MCILYKMLTETVTDNLRPESMRQFKNLRDCMAAIEEQTSNVIGIVHFRDANILFRVYKSKMEALYHCTGGFGDTVEVLEERGIIMGMIHGAHQVAHEYVNAPKKTDGSTFVVDSMPSSHAHLHVVTNSTEVAQCTPSLDCNMNTPKASCSMSFPLPNGRLPYPFPFTP
jgi:hypothetical protein